MKFSGYSFDKKLVECLSSLGYEECTPIQEKTLALALKKQSFIAKAETGSGKTHAFLVPSIENLNKDLNKIQVIIIEPTLELCNQVSRFGDAISSIYKCFRMNNICASIFKKNDLITCDRATILLTTPGKLEEVIKNKNIDLSSVQSVILDEADMLLEGEQATQTLALIDVIKHDQLMVFTATMKEHEIASLKKLLKVSTLIDVNKKNYTSKNVSHHFVDIKHMPLEKALITFLEAEKPYFTMVFASKKQTIDKTYKALCSEGIRCALISSDVSSRERKNILKRVNDGEFDLILCSDLASRGLDFPHVSHVISLDIPSNIDYYYHRSGRTGRYKNKGDSYIFYDDELNIKSKKSLEKKLEFDYLILRKEGLKKDKKHTPQVKKKNEKLEAEIKKEVAKVRSNKVKPNYKKKIKKAIKKAMKNHKRKIIMENLRNKRKMQSTVD